MEKEEFEASKKAIETQTIAEDAQRDLGACSQRQMCYSKITASYNVFFLDEAMPALLAAEASLKSLNKNDITEVRSMKRPPAGVVYVIESICIVKNIKPNKVNFIIQLSRFFSLMQYFYV